MEGSVWLRFTVYSFKMEWVESSRTGIYGAGGGGGGSAVIGQRCRKPAGAEPASGQRAPLSPGLSKCVINHIHCARMSKCMCTCSAHTCTYRMHARTHMHCYICEDGNFMNYIFIIFYWVIPLNVVLLSGNSLSTSHNVMCCDTLCNAVTFMLIYIDSGAHKTTIWPGHTHTHAHNRHINDSKALEWTFHYAVMTHHFLGL